MRAKKQTVQSKKEGREEREWVREKEGVMFILGVEMLGPRKEGYASER